MENQQCVCHINVQYELPTPSFQVSTPLKIPSFCSSTTLSFSFCFWLCRAPLFLFLISTATQFSYNLTT